MTTLALRNNQLACVMTAAATLPVKARDAFLKHLADQLPDGFTDAETRRGQPSGSTASASDDRVRERTAAEVRPKVVQIPHRP